MVKARRRGLNPAEPAGGDGLIPGNRHLGMAAENIGGRQFFGDAILAGIYNGGSRARCLNLPNMTRFDGIAENDARVGHRILAEGKRYVQEFSRGMEAAETGCSRRWSGSADYADCAQTETVVGRPTLEFRRFFWQKRVLVPTKNARVGSFLSDPMVRVGGNATSSMHSTGIRSTRFWCEEAELI